MRGLGSGHVTCGPMRGLEINFTGRGQTHRQTDGHRDYMTELAQWADSVKIQLCTPEGRIPYGLYLQPAQQACFCYKEKPWKTNI